MPKKAWTFRSKVLLVVIVTVFFTAVTIQFSAQRETERAILAAYDENAVNLINTVAVHVESEYRSILFHESATLDRRKTELRHIVALAIASIERYHHQQEEGLLPEAESQRLALETVKAMRYDNGVGYLWINDMSQPYTRMLMHPTIPELDGRLLDDPRFDCVVGTQQNLFNAFNETCRDHGEGFVDYLWPKPTEDGLTEDRLKTSYVKQFEPWNWIVGTGVYIDDIEADKQRRFEAVLSDLQQAFSRIRLAETGYLFIFNADKELLVHPSADEEGTEAGANTPEKRTDLLGELMEAAKTPSVPVAYLWDKPGHRDAFRFLKRAYVTHFEPLDWYIVASFYNSELERPADALRSRIFLLSIPILIAALAFAVLISGGLLEPLRRLTLAAVNIEREGIHSAEIPISGTAETIELGTILRKMIESIKRSEQELKKANADLESVIVELRSAEREREELIVALEAQNSQLERFAYTVSHDLKTPLITIKGHIGALAEDLKQGNTEFVQEDMTHISNAADRMAALLNDVLELSKIGRLVNPPEDVPLAELVEEILQLLHGQIQENGVQVNVSADLPVVYVDRTRLQEVIQNLIENAIKYMGDQPQPVIEIGIRDDGGAPICFVRDNGIGIEDCYHEKIFSLFDQLDRNVDGTGIGLALVKRIVEIHGGRIWVESEGLGHGSTFCFSLAAKSTSQRSESGEWVASGS